MPQMAPLPWLSVLMVSFMILIFLMTIVYFIHNPLPKESEGSTILLKKFDWKW
uniref:ATP synthase complex subunit 8 n=1 Tax=Branchinella kugenumaensis TaxID=381660 RepID=A0A6B9UCT9_9CRUS|nr:ATP synthase F0 subunit 8 [Branchinella kugenumaensis]